MFWLRAFSYLPFPVLYAFSDFCYFTLYHIIRYRRKLVHHNLKVAFPEKLQSELVTIERAFYRNLCDYGVETIKLVSMSAAQISKRMVYKNPELVGQYAMRGESLLLLTSHQFNWEWLLASGCLNLPLPVDFVYQQQSSRFFNDFSLFTRSRFGGFPVQRSEVARVAIRRKDIQRGIAIMADQFPGHANDKKYWTQFLNQNTAFYEGIGQLAHLTQYRALFFGVRKLKRGYYEAEAVVVAEPPYEKGSSLIVEGYVKAVEKIIREQPAGWLWSHNRWKDRD